MVVIASNIEDTRYVTASGHSINVKRYGLVAYLDAYREMSALAASRGREGPDQVWLLEHEPVYTQGTACQLGTMGQTDIPIVKTDRGGQITYHGPGQIVMYPLLDLKRYGLGVKALVSALEQAVIDTLDEFNIRGRLRDKAPGVYVDGAKIAALGLRIRHGTSYHGLSFNVNMNLQPFDNIDPCGYQGLRVTQLADLCERPAVGDVRERLLAHFLALI